MSSTITLDREDWLDIGDDSSLPSLSIEQVLNDVDLLDDNLSFLEDSEEQSVLLSTSPAPSSPNISYHLDSVLEANRLDSISHQLISLVDKCGGPRAIAEQEGHVAVGTSKGAVLLFDAQGRLDRFVPTEESTGAASCICLSPDRRSVAVGYAKGAIKVYNVKSGSVQHNVQVAVQPGRGVLQILYISKTHNLLVLDSGGNVFEMRLGRSIIGKKAPQIRCVFSGCNGEVVRMKLLPQSLLALFTVTRVLLVSTRFGGAVLCAFPLKTGVTLPPLVEVLSQNRRKDELTICVGRGQEVSAFTIRVSMLGTKHKAALLLRHWLLPVSAVSMHGIRSRSVMVLDAQGSSMLLDLDDPSGTTVPSNHSQLEIVFSSADYKGLSTGGNVSAALRVLAESVCYETTQRVKDGVLVLCHDGLYKVSALSEEQQLLRFDERNDSVSACLYLLDIYRGVVTTSPEFSVRIPQLIRKHLTKVTSFTLDGCKEGKVIDLLAHYKKYIAILLKVVLGAKMNDMLYDDIWPRLERDVLSRSVCLEALDEYVLDGVLSDAPPALVSAYLTNLALEGHFSQMQAAIVRFPIYSIDLHLVMSTCRQNNLYDGIIYVMNKALGDYITPLEEMFESVSHLAGKEVLSDSEIEQVTRLLLYIHCCFAGHAYPYGALPADQAEKVPIEVYRCVTSLKGKDGAAGKVRYPNLRILMQLDPQQFVHVIWTCVDSRLLKTEGRLQRLAETLGNIVVELRSETALVHFLRLAVQLIEGQHVVLHTQFLQEAVVTVLSLRGPSPAVDTVVLDAMRADAQLDRERIIRISISPLRPQVCTFIFNSDRRFVDLIQCFLVYRLPAVFDVIGNVLRSSLSTEERTTITDYVTSVIRDLTTINASLCAEMVLEHFSDLLSQLALSGKELCQVGRDVKETHIWTLVIAVVSLCRQNGQRQILGDEDKDEALFCVAFNGIVDSAMENKDQTLVEMLEYWLPMGSQTDLCLNSAAAADCPVATVLLLEARQLLPRAFEMLHDQLRHAQENGFLASLDRLLMFCARHSVEAKENRWLLVVFRTAMDIAVKGQLHDMESRLHMLTSRILSNGSEHAIELFHCLMEYPVFREGTHGEHGALFECILSACSFEKTLFDETLSCMNAESTVALLELTSTTSRRICPGVALPICVLCRSTLTKAAYTFPCGHVVHIECCLQTRECLCQNRKRLGIVSDRNLDMSDLLSQTTQSDVMCSSRKRDIFVNWERPLRLAPSHRES